MNTPDHDIRDIDQGTPPRGSAPYPQDDPLAAAGRRADEWARKAYYPEDPRRKSPALAMILSLMPGIGQIYVGYYQLGFTHILVVSTIITLLANGHDIGLRALEPLLGVFLAFFWLYNLIDAGRRAAFFNHALAGLEKADLPQEMQMPSGGGSLVGGIALVAFGLVLFSNTMFQVSLDWLEHWWPIAIVGGGAYLIYRSVQDRSRRAAERVGDSSGN